MELGGKNILVVGLGKSGQAAARLCLMKGARVTATDSAPSPQGAGALGKLGAELALGGHRSRDFERAEVIVLSPGVDHRLPEVVSAKERGAQVMGEMELGFRFLRAPAVMITGTNGKSTVTTLTGHILEAAGKRVFTGGNLGDPLCTQVLDGPAIDWAVLEVSSFQTDTAAELRPKIGVILNLSPDHMDRYDSFEQYADSKFRILARQGGDDLAVLCMDDAQVAARKGLAPARLWPYASKGPLGQGGWLEGDDLVIAAGSETIRLDAARCPLQGGFNRLNMLAASMACLAAGCRPADIGRALGSFQGLPHRLQLVASVNGVDWLDDSKGTNVGAVKAALGALSRPVVLLLGGRDKDGRFADLEPELKQWAAAVICFGEAGPKIRGQLGAITQCGLAAGLPQAVEMAAGAARPGQAVLLSPGCASFDAYEGYAARGRHFQALVKGEKWPN